MAFYVYHVLALTFIVVGLRTPRSKAGVDAFHVGFLKTISVIVQALAGLAILYFFHRFIDPSVSPAVGMLLPLGFGMGPGIALSVGSSWEAYGIQGAGEAGLAIATAGFVVAYVVGVWVVNRGVRDGLVVVRSIETSVDDGELPDGQNNVHSNSSNCVGSVKAVCVVIVCTALIYLITYFVMIAVSSGMTKAGLATEIPVLWSLSFLWANLLAMAFRKSVGWSKAFATLLNHPVVDRMVSVLADILIATAVMAIGLTLAPAYFLPLLIACVLGAVVTYFIVRDSTRWAFKEHAYTRFAGLFGEQTGNVSSGLALIRIVDPGYQTPVARDQVLGSGTALILGFPLLLLINLPLTRFGGSATGYAVVAGLLTVYLVVTIIAWRAVHRRFN